jgi:hypothetical protein
MFTSSMKTTRGATALQVYTYACGLTAPLYEACVVGDAFRADNASCDTSCNSLLLD